MRGRSRRLKRGRGRSHREWDAVQDIIGNPNQEWPAAGGALSLTPAEAAYLESFTGTTMLLAFIVLGSMMLAARPSLALGPVMVTPPPMPTVPGPTTTLPPTAPPEQAVEVALPRHPSGRVMRRLDV